LLVFAALLVTSDGAYLLMFNVLVNAVVIVNRGVDCSLLSSTANYSSFIVTMQCTDLFDMIRSSTCHFTMLC